MGKRGNHNPPKDTHPTPPFPPPKNNKIPLHPKAVFGTSLCIGGVAQLGERLLCTQEVIGSIPFTSTILFPLYP